MAISKSWTMLSSDINEVGQRLGYDWNFICEELRKEELYGQDGIGYIEIDVETEFDSLVLKKIFDKIFSENKGMRSILVLDNF